MQENKKTTLRASQDQASSDDTNRQNKERLFSDSEIYIYMQNHEGLPVHLEDL
jgi:hypothetical protein